MPESKANSITRLVVILVSFAFLLIMGSCRSVNKLFNKQKSTTDSSHQVKKQWDNVTQVDSNIYTLKRDSLKEVSEHTYKTKITIENASGKIILDAANGKGFIDSLKGSKVTIEHDGSITNSKTNTATTEQKGNVTRQDHQQGKSEEKTKVQSKNKTVDSSKETKGVHPVLIICLLILFILACICFYARYNGKSIMSVLNIFKSKNQ